MIMENGYELYSVYMMVIVLHKYIITPARNLSDRNDCPFRSKLAFVLTEFRSNEKPLIVCVT